MNSPNHSILQNITVLVVESDSQLALMIENSLHQFGAAVFRALNAKEAFQLLMEHDFEIAVVDLTMTNIDSVAFLQEALKVWPWLGVVALNDGHRGRQRQVEELGRFRFIEKPFTCDILVEEVLGEYRDKHEKVEEGEKRENVQLEKSQFKLRGLRRLMEQALEADTLVDTLRFLCLGIGPILPFAVVGVMGSEEDYLIIFNVQKKVSPRFIETLTEIIHNRYEALTGRTVLLDSIRIEQAGMAPQTDGSDLIGSTFSVPVITAGELRGIITIATLPDNHYTTADATFMYYAANQLSTVFAAMKQIRRLAVRDPMTGLFNRLQLDQEMDRTWRRQSQTGKPLSVAVMDIDHFKTVNDTYGHLVGDDVLREFSRLLQKSCQPSYVLGRYGGEEFVIIMPDVAQEGAVEHAVSFIEKVRSHVFCEKKNPLRITVSIGLTSFDPQTKRQVKSPEQLFTEADQAMYMAKRAGRDCLRIWSARKTSGTGEEWQDQDKLEGKSIYRMQRRDPGIMIIEDDYALRRLLEKVVRQQGYRVESWNHPAAALGRLKENPAEYDLIITDLSGRQMKGIEIIREILAVDETLIVIIVSAYATIDSAVECLRVGAYDIMQKPFQFKQAVAILRRALDYRRTLLENRQYEQRLLEMVRQNSAKIIENMEEIKNSYNFTLEALVGLLDARERDSGNHSKRVRDLTLLLARRMGFIGNELEDIGRGALLHDLGKIGVPDRILLKKDRLTPEEWRIMRQHPTIGYRILQYSSYLKNAAEIVCSHQEKWNGKGYPRGLAGEKICIGARIFAVVDAYDAMRTDRHYRQALSGEQALQEIKAASGQQFDPRVVEAFLTHRQELEDLLQLLFKQKIDETIA